jgi:hypothetical protein
MPIVWPLQRDATGFYGDPYKPGFEAAHITRITPPFQMFYGSILVRQIAVNKKCADAFMEWFGDIWKNAEQKQFAVNAWGMSSFSGSWNVRPMRTGTRPSMHAFGCAMDFDAARNAQYDHTPNFGVQSIHDNVVLPFKKLGGVWGGDWPNATDGMHFQFARVA